MKPQQAYYKAYDLGKRIPELELIICKNTHYSYSYARDVIKGRWELVEPNISKNACWSYWYAKHIIKGRWELAEPAISKDAEYSYLYAVNIIKGRWELGEPTISQDAESSYCYALYVIKGRLPDFMHNALLLSNNESAKQYVEFISKNPDCPNNII